VLATLAAAPSYERQGPHAMASLANDLATILATGTSYAYPGEPMGDEEAALLWPARTGQEADDRRALVSAAAAYAASMPDADLSAALFGDGQVPYPQGQTGKSADAPAQPGHQVFTGHAHACSCRVPAGR
jgi:hypothetical protein